MFYNNAGRKTAVVLRGRGGATKYSPATTKKFIFFQLRRASERGVDSRQGERGSFDTISALVKIRKSVVHSVAPTLSHLNMRSRINAAARARLLVAFNFVTEFHPPRPRPIPSHLFVRSYQLFTPVKYFPCNGTCNNRQPNHLSRVNFYDILVIRLNLHERE